MRIKLKPRNYGKFRAKVENAFEEYVGELAQECTNVIEDPNAFSDIGLVDHDIVWTGQLRDSQQVTDESEGRKRILRLSWDPVSDNGFHYAPLVYNGFVAGTKYYPPRHWPEMAAERLGGLPKFAAKVREEGI